MPASSDPSKRSRANTRARLMDAALEVFAERGFQAATVEGVCDAAGFTRGAFYSSFGSKEELFLAVWSSRAAGILADLRTLAEQLDRTPTRAEELIDEMVQRVTSDRQWFLVSTEFVLHAIRHPDTAAAFAEHRRELRAGLAEIVVQLADMSGSDIATAEVDRRTRQVIAAIEGCQHQVWVEPDQLADGELQVTMVRKLLA